MKKPLMGFVLLFAATWAFGVRAQEQSVADLSTKAEGNAASDFSATTAAQVNLMDTSAEGVGTRSFATAAPADPSPAAPAAAPPPKPKYIFGDRDDYRWQLALGVEFFRFQSKLIDASMVGLNTTITYYTNDWFALEGNIVTGFAPEIYGSDHVKYFGGAGGVRIGARRARFEPWGHALVGMGHLQPQTAGNSRNTFAVQAGIGLDFRVNSRLSLRAETDWVRTQFFDDVQNNFQAVAAIVFHF
jgi:opacity protein-like surface antigen